MSALDAALDELYGVSPKAFVATRERLVKQLKAAGEDPSGLKGLPRPTASAWAVNQAVRRAPEEARRFLSACDAMRGAGKASDPGAAYRAAVGAQRPALEALLGEARAALADAGLATSPSLLERVANDLRWGGVSPEHRAALEQGRLEQDVPAPDLSALEGAVGELRPRRVKTPAPPKARPAPPPPPPAPRAAPPKPAPRPAGPSRARLERRAETARRDLERARRDEASLRRELARLDKELDAATRRVAAAEAKLTEAEAALAASR